MGFTDFSEEDQAAYLDWARFVCGIERDQAIANEELFVEWFDWRNEATQFRFVIARLNALYPDRLDAMERFTSDGIEDPLSMRILCIAAELEILHMCGQNFSEKIYSNCGVSLESQDTEALFTRLMVCAEVINSLKAVTP